MAGTRDTYTPTTKKGATCEGCQIAQCIVWWNVLILSIVWACQMV